MPTRENRRKIHRLIAGLTAVALLTTPFTASAFDWNAETGFFQWLFGRQGYFTPESGHTLATACAFDEASKRAETDPTLKVALEQALSTKIPKGMSQIQYSVPYQLVTFGNWGNEIFTNSNLEGKASHSDAGEFLKGRYHKWLSSKTARAVYLGAQTSEGYSGTYYLHSQKIDGRTQDESYDAIRRHITTVLRYSIENLRAAERKGDRLPEFTGAFKGLAPEQCDERCKGLALLGSAFHVMEDSTGSCSDAAKKALADAGLQGCEQGDGHVIVDWTRAGRPQVVTLSDDTFYQERTDVHARLDGLFTSCDSKAFEYSKDGRTFDMNPKFVNADILAAVARAISTNESSEDAAKRIWRDVIASRFAERPDRKPMPPPAPSTKTKWQKRISDAEEWLDRRAWQPATNKLWYGLGRFVAWVDHKYGDADGWNEGVATAWGITHGSNVSRNASTRAPGAPGASAPGTPGTSGASGAGYPR